MFIKKIILLVLTSTTLMHAEPTNTHQLPSTTNQTDEKNTQTKHLFDNNTENKQASLQQTEINNPTDALTLETTSEQNTVTLRGPKNESFSNVRVYNTLQTKDLYVEGNTVIGANLKVNQDTVIGGNLIVDGTISGGGSVSGPGSSTPNAIAIFADGSGTAITDSPVLIDGTGNMSGINNLAMTGNINGPVNITMTGGDLTGVQNITMNGDLTGVTNITASGVIAAQDLSSSGTLFVSAIANINSPAAVVTWPTMVGAAGTFLGIDMSGNLAYSTPLGAGDVSAAVNFTTNNRVVLTDTPSGAKNVKESANVVIDGSGNITGVNTLNATTVTAPTLNGNATTATSASNVGGKTAAEVATSVNATQAATNSGTPNTLVLRDGVGQGGFTAGKIIATEFSGPLTGNANTATSATTAGTATNFSGSLSGDVMGNQNTTSVSSIGGGAMISSTIISGVNLANNATDLNTANRIVKRDGSGGFFAGTINATFVGPLTGNVTGNVSGNAATATSAVTSTTSQWFTQNLAGDVTGPQLATVVQFVGNKTTAQVVQSVDDTIAATANNTASTIVKRDGSRHFSVDSITIVNAPMADTDATNKAYVDSIAAGLEPKTPVLVTSIIQTPTASLATPIDGVTLSANDRVLLTQQSYRIDNGIWLAQSTAWTRPADFANGSLAGQAFVLTTSGLTLAGTGWLCNTPLAIVGTDTVTFVQFSSSGQTTAANVGTGVGQLFRDKTGLTLNFKTLAEGNFIDITNGMNEVTLAVTATSDNTPNTVVSRDATGTFAGSLTGAASLNVLKSGDTMTGNLLMANQSEVRFGDSGSKYVGIKAPATVGTSYTFAWPTNVPTAGQFLKVVTGGTDTSLTWTTVGSPALTKTYYVDLSGSDSNDGSLASPFRTIKYAVSVAKVGANPFSNPRIIHVGAGSFTEEQIVIDVNGLSIVGSIEHGTIIRPANPAANLIVITVPYVELSNFTLQVTPGASSQSAIDMSISTYGRSRFNQLGFAFFNTGFSLSNTSTSALPIFMENLQFGHNLTDIRAINSQIILSGSYFNGPTKPSTNPPGYTGIALEGQYCIAHVFSSYFSYLNNAITAAGGANASISDSSIEKTNNGILCSGASKAQLVGINFSLNNATSVNVTATGVGTLVYIEGCLFDCEDESDNSAGTAIKIVDGASSFINGCIIEKAIIGLECGTSADTATTVMKVGSVSIIDTATSIRQRGASTLQFVGGALDISTLDIANPTNVDFAGFNANGEAHLAIGKITDVHSDIYEILNGQPSLPNLAYEPNYYGYKGTMYRNPNDNPTFNATQSDFNDAAYYVVTGNNTKEACLHLISDSNNIGDPANVRGWSICKTGTTAELVFTFTNNDPGVGTPNCGPYDVMRLNGFANQVEFPIATGTLPTNLTAKLLWGADTNLYRSAADTLKTDDNFIVGGTLTAGGALTAGSTFVSTLTVGAGTAASPSLQFVGSTNTGFSAQTANRLSFDTFGVERMSIDSTGTVSINQFTIAGVVHNNAAGKLSSSLIVNADIAANAAIVDTKLATISTAGKVLDSATTATSNNIFNTIVKRDTSGNFAATMITASLTGMVTGTASFNVLKIGDTMTGNLTLPAGTAAAPSLNFTGGTTTGLSMPSANYLSFDTNGIERMSIESTGTINALGTLVLAAGTAAQPSLKFANGTNTGFSSATANQLSFDTLGVERMNIESTGTVNVLGTLVLVAGTATAPSLKFTNGTNTGLSSATANRISFETSGVEKMSMDASSVTVTAAAFIIGNLLALDSMQVDTPAAGAQVVTVQQGKTVLLIIPSGANVTSYAITMPVNPINGQLLTITVANSVQVNGITYPGSTVYFAVTQLRSETNFTASQNGQSVTYIYYAATSSWYRYSRG